MNLVAQLLISGLAVFVAGYILPGVHIANFGTAIIIAIVLGVVNTFVKPVLTILTFPLTVVTLGLFLIILNGLMILLTSAIVPGFKVDGILWAIIFGFVMSGVSSVLHSLTK